MPPEEEYIGDGIYVSFDGQYFTLRAPREGGDHYIHLEIPDVLIHFLAFVDRNTPERQ